MKFPGCYNIFTSAILFVVAGLIHLTAFSIWAGNVKLQFSNCTHFIPYHGTKSVCGETGADYAFVIVFVFAAASIFYYALSREIKKIEKDKEVDIGLVVDELK